MIYAKEAYFLTSENKQKNSAKELFNIEKIIKKAISLGKYSIEINKNIISKETCNELKKFGYKIKKSYVADFYLISWEE